MKSKTPSARIQKTLALLPLTPGVYFMKDGSGKILYIGKAQSLKKRVSSYFHGRPHAPKISVLVPKIQRIDTIETASEMDALLLEAHLIKRYQPPYNTELRDDKSYPMLKITGDAFPRLIVTRNRKEGRGTFYGPYTDSKLLREAVRIINSIFPIRKCIRLPKSACLYYHIGQCAAPCIKPDIGAEYSRHIKEIKRFLGGGKRSLIDYLSDRMHSARGDYRFEDAQFYKDQIDALGSIQKKRFHLKSPEGGIGLRGTMEIKRAFHLKRLPEHIACFDVSNVQGDQAVASKVSFHRELENKMEYRRYKIKTVTGINDYAMIQEALKRLLAGVREGREAVLPDLILIDGGRGHLNAACEVLRKEGFDGQPIASIAKQFEFLFIPQEKNPIVLPAASAGLRLLQKIRDEAHRFAITYHRKLKRSDMTVSKLDELAGIGLKRKRKLLKHFGSVEAVKSASPQDIAAVCRLSINQASSLLEYLQRTLR